mgnify:CR=1 FL=1
MYGAMQRDYRREYDTYYGIPGSEGMTHLQLLHRREKTSRNKARSLMAKKYGRKKLRGLDVDHKDSNPLNNSPGNIRLMAVHANRGGPRVAAERAK